MQHCMCTLICLAQYKHKIHRLYWKKLLEIHVIRLDHQKDDVIVSVQLFRLGQAEIFHVRWTGSLLLRQCPGCNPLRTRPLLTLPCPAKGPNAWPFEPFSAGSAHGDAELSLPYTDPRHRISATRLRSRGLWWGGGGSKLLGQERRGASNCVVK